MDKNFDFDDNRAVPSTKNSSGCKAFYTTFQCDKPYRLAFYVQPNIRRRRLVVNRTDVNNTTSNVDSTRSISSSSATQLSSIQNTTMNKTEEIIKPATKRGNVRKRVNNKENEGKNKSKNNKNEESKTVLFEAENTFTRQSGRLRELNFKRAANTTTEKEPEPSKDEMIEVKKKRYSATYAKKPAKPKEPTRTKQKEPTRTKQKDTTKKKTKPDPDFEKWAENLNKEFDEVDNFNISVSYD